MNKSFAIFFGAVFIAFGLGMAILEAVPVLKGTSLIFSIVGFMISIMGGLFGNE